MDEEMRRAELLGRLAAIEAILGYTLKIAGGSPADLAAAVNSTLGQWAGPSDEREKAAAIEFRSTVMRVSQVARLDSGQDP